MTTTLKKIILLVSPERLCMSYLSEKAKERNARLSSVVYCSCSNRAFPETKKEKDKYGQNYRYVCPCGITTNWHTSFSNAEIALRQNHETT